MNNSTLRVLQQELDNAAATVLRVAGRINKEIDSGDPVTPPPPTIAEQIERKYGKPLEELTSQRTGWVFVGATEEGFRCAVTHDAYLAYGDVVGFWAYSFDSDERYLILRKLKRITLEETGEVRRAGDGEWWADGSGYLRRGPTNGAHPIYRRLPDKE